LLNIHHSNAVGISISDPFPQFVEKGFYTYFCRLQKN